MQGLEIRPVTLQDAAAIADIYNYYIHHTIVTFELTPIDAANIQARIERISQSFPFLVASLDNQIVGYAYADKWKERAAYDYAAETSIYLRNGFEGRRIGTALYGQLIELVRQTTIKTVIGGVSLPNEGSVVLHEKLGFKKIGEFERVGYKFNQWINVGYWQLHF